jgi:site-specific recombinase XerD
MLELYFKYPKVLRRLRSGALGEEMDRVAAHFSELGYKRGSARNYISQLARFGAFAARDAAGATIGQDVIDRFVQSLLSAASRIAARTAIAHARRLTPHRFSVPPRRTAPDPDQPLFAAYLDYLHRVRGLAPKTCEGLLTVARRIVAWYHGHLPGWPLAMMTGEHVLALVEHLLSLSANDYTRSSTATYTRTFLHFLQWSGLNDEDLARFVPRTPCWRLAHLPPRLAWDDVRCAIDAIDATAPSGLRDRAILLLLATTGLRNKELRLLELQHIRWRAAEVVVCHAKSRRDRVVPLVQEAGAALADYVLHARPKTDCRRVFLSQVPPVRSFGCSSTVSRIVRSRLTQGGIALPRVAGAHLIRHSLATRMVRERRPINEVADLLGHCSIDTTAIYVKVALPQLADVALPFPGGAP